MNLLGEFLCFDDVGFLRLFRATGKEKQDGVSNSVNIDSVTRPVVDAQFADAFADRFDIAKVAEREPTNTNLNVCSGLFVARFTPPACEEVSLSDLDICEQ